MLSPRAHCLQGHEVSGAYCLRACCLRGGLPLGHVVSQGRLSLGHNVFWAYCLWGMGHIVSGADCLGTYCLRGTLPPGLIVLWCIVLGQIVSGHHVPQPFLRKGNGSFKKVSWKFSWSFKEVSRVFQGNVKFCFEEVLRVI